MSEKESALLKGVNVLKALRGHSLNGLSNQQIASTTGYTPSTVTRILKTLSEAGMAEKRDDGRFALGLSILQIATRHAMEMDQAQEKINEMNRRIFTGAKQ